MEKNTIKIKPREDRVSNLNMVVRILLWSHIAFVLVAILFSLQPSVAVYALPSVGGLLTDRMERTGFGDRWLRKLSWRLSFLLAGAFSLLMFAGVIMPSSGRYEVIDFATSIVVLLSVWYAGWRI